MKRYDDNREKFVNPYNFVSLHKEVERSKCNKGSLSGVIKCGLTTKTPLFIPNTSNSDAFAFDKEVRGHKSYDYYSYQNNEGLTAEDIKRSNPKPIIPGSELRGMIRSVYETITNSCISSISNKPISGRYDRFLSVNDKRYEDEAGVLIWDEGQREWKLHKAHQYEFMDNDPKYIKIKNGENYYYYNNKEYHNLAPIPVYGYEENVNGAKILRAYFNERRKGENQNIKKERTVLLLNGKKLNPDKKNYTHASVFVWEDNLVVDNKDLVSKLVKNLTATMIEYSDPKVNKNLNSKFAQHFGYKGYLRGRSNSSKELNPDKKIPVWIIKENGYIYLTPSKKGRYTYNNQIEQFIPKHMPCKFKNEVCPTCNLFGFIGKDSLKGRLKFFDASVKEEKQNYTLNSYKEGIVTLQELAGPHIGCQEFYTNPYLSSQDLKSYSLTENRYSYWNFDIVNEDGMSRRTLGNNKQRLELNGRKYYWHNQDWEKTAFTKLKTKRNTTIRPIRDGLDFSFEIAFTDITEEELGNLIFCLNLGDNKDNHCHKLGHAKPLGFGSVKIQVDDVIIRTVCTENTNITYKVESVDFSKYQKSIKNDDVYEQLMLITDFDSMKGANVRYPLGEEIRFKDKGKDKEIPSYTFFMINKYNGTKPYFYYQVPRTLRTYQLMKVKSLVEFMSYNKIIKE